VTVPLGRLAWRLISRHRRSLAGLLVAVAVLLGLSSVAPARPRLRPVVVAARDLPAGQLLAVADLRVAAEPAALAPDGALADPSMLVGQALAGAVRRGEPLTDLRLVGPGLLAGGPGLVLAPVRMADAAEVALVHVGDVIDVLAAATPETGPASAHLVALGARVLAIPESPADAGVSDGALVVLAVSDSTARDLAAAEAGERLTLVLEDSRTTQ
jgi:pilus assembly protein CpaB